MLASCCCDKAFSRGIFFRAAIIFLVAVKSQSMELKRKFEVSERTKVGSIEITSGPQQAQRPVA